MVLSFLKSNLPIIGLVLIFVSFAVYGFPDSPAPWFDEGLLLGIAKSSVENGVFSLEVAPGEFVQERPLLITTNYPLLAWIAASFKLFGVGLAQAKIVMLVFLAVFAMLFYRLAAESYGRTNARWALALLVSFLPFYGNGKSVLGEIPGLVYFLGGLLLLKHTRKRELMSAGALLGLAIATKPIYLLLAVSVGIGEFVWAIRERHLDYRRWALLIAGGIPPLAVWLYTLLPADTGVDYWWKMFALYRNPYNIDPAIIENVFRFFRESTPIHLALLLASFFLYKGLWGMRSWTRMEIIIGAFAVLNLAFYVRTVGWYRYFFPAHILLLMVFPVSLYGILEKIASEWMRRIGAVSLAAVFIVQLTYSATAVRQALYYDPSARTFGDLVRERMRAGERIFVVNQPEIGFFLDREALMQHIQINPYVAVGRDVFAENFLPRYVVADSWEGSDYLSRYKKEMERYRRVAQIGSYRLYERR